MSPLLVYIRMDNEWIQLENTNDWFIKFFYAYFGVLASEGKGDFFNIKAYSPGTGDTVIIKAVPPGELLLLAEFSLSIVFVR